MILFICILILALVIGYTIFYCIKDESFFNHVSLFSAGFCLYFLMPIFIGEIRLFAGNDLFATFNYLYDRITMFNKSFYLLFILVVYMGMILGTFLCKHRQKRKTLDKKKENKLVNFWQKSFSSIKKSRQNIIGVMLILISIVYIVKFWPYFFSSYSTDINRGNFAAVVLVNFSFILLYDINIYKNEKDIKKTIFNIYNLIFVILNVLLLSLGTRMYFISIIFSILVCVNNYFKINFKKISILFAILFAFLGLVALLRSNYTLSIYSGILTNLMEFLYTFISSLKFMQLGINEIINVPKFLFSNLVNLIPTFILPTKLSYILNPEDYGFVIYSPQGALSAYVDLSMNFGLIGSFGVMFLLGYFFEILKVKKDNVLIFTIYSMMCGFIVFSFYRDGFLTSIIKNILEFSIIIPIIYYLILTFNIRRDNEKGSTNKRN